MADKKKIEQIQHRVANGEIRAIGENSRTYELSFSSEMPVERWYGSEILSHDPEAVNLQRIIDVGTVLFSHGRDTNIGRLPIASIDSVWLETNERKLKAKITFDDDEESEKIHRKVKNGMLRGVSFGYSVSSWEEVAAGKQSVNGRHTGPAYIALRWEPFEISLEPTPADPSVGVGREIETITEKPADEKTSWFFDIRRKIAK